MRHPRGLQHISFAVLLASALLGACGHHGLEGKYGFLGVFDERPPSPQRTGGGFLVGMVSAEPPTESRIVVFVYRSTPAEAPEIIDWAVLEQPGPYLFGVPAGTYHVAAFEDRDRNFHYNPGRDRAALYHDGGPIVLMPGRTVDRLDLKLRGDEPPRIEFDVTMPTAGRGSAL
jgi:hypothetical protein